MTWTWEELPEEMLGIPMDTWMNIIGMTGVSLLLLSVWLVVRGFADPRTLHFRTVRLVALFMVMTPLFLRWYLSASLLLTISGCMITLSLVMMAKKRFLG